MSNEEKAKRKKYIQTRNKWIKFQLIIIPVVLLLCVISFITYSEKNKEYYINYQESCNIDYRVYLKDNDFYDEDYLEKDKSYVAETIDFIQAEFKYELELETSNIDYAYEYKIEAVVEIVDKNSDAIIYNPSYTLVEGKDTIADSDKSLELTKLIEVNYDKYNVIATNFNEVYKLPSVENTLKIVFSINVLSECSNFVNDNNNQCIAVINVPLTEKTVNIKTTTNTDAFESKILACYKSDDYKVFFNLGLAASILEVVLIIVLLVYIYATRNHDINYGIKIKRIIASYKSFIQKICNDFDSTDYQIVKVGSINELLEIRDIILSPILMYENDDKTCSKFMIPTSTKLLYLFEIKVDDYDLIYGK